MTLKKDLTDIGYLLITPNPKKFRFEGVNYRRAGIQLQVGALVTQVVVVGGFLYGPMIIDKAVELKDSMKRRYYANKK